MKIRGLGLWLLTSWLLLAAVGCATVPEAAPSSLREEKAICSQMLTAIQNDSAADFLALLHADTRMRFGKKQFSETRGNVVAVLGEIKSFEFLSVLEMPALTPVIYKVRFERTVADGSKVYQETLFRVVFGKLDGKLCVVSFGFM